MTLERLARAGGLLLGIGCAVAVAGEGGPYRLGVGDEIRVGVQDQPQASGTATISDDGTIALPLLDRLAVEGMTLREATEAVRARLALRIVDPAVAVDVARYRPFFVLGDVATAGIYPWFPGATVAQAVAAAGGYRGRSDYLQSATAGIRAAEAIDSARYQLADARVQEARVRAELEGRATVPSPEVEHPALAGVMAGFVLREQEVLVTRSNGFAKQVELLKREQEIRTDEIAALDGRIKAQGRQGENLRREIAEIQGLIARGLSPTSRLNDLNREESRLLSDTLQTQVLLNQARNGRNQAELQLSTATRERRLQALGELQETVAKIQRLRLQLRAETSILLESSVLQGQPGGEGIRTTFRLQPRGTPLQRAVEEDAAIAPGDVLRVERLLAPPPARAVGTCSATETGPTGCGAAEAYPTLTASPPASMMAAPFRPTPAAVQPAPGMRESRAR